MKIILNPAAVVVWILGLTLIWFDATQQRWGWSFLLTPWMLTKLAGVLFLTWWHHYLMVAQKRFAAGVMLRTERFWRMTKRAAVPGGDRHGAGHHHQVRLLTERLIQSLCALTGSPACGFADN